MTTVKIDIWSDIRCPFCYIGKRKFELALSRFNHLQDVTVTWHSFQLDPGLKTQPGLQVYDYLAAVKGLTREQTIGMHDHVRQAAADVGLKFNFDKVVVANSFNGHRLIQLAKAKGLAPEAEEALFRAHFTEGKNIDDSATLVQIGREIGIDESEVRSVIESDQYTTEVSEDQAMARALGIRGVPFFIFNDKFAVSGAQQPELFLQALSKAWHDRQVQV